MSQYVIRRLLLFIPVIVLVSILIFAIMRVLPGDIASIILSGGAADLKVDPQQLAELRHKLGIDRALTEQYFTWVSGLLRLDGGVSLWTGRPVFEEIGRTFPVSFELAILTIIVAFAMAIPMGVLMATKADTWVDYVFRVVSVSGMCLPTFWTGTLAIIFLVIVFDWMPPLEFKSLSRDPWSNLQQLAIPSLVMGYYVSAPLSRMLRSSLLEVLRQDYVRTARAKGLTEGSVLSRHVLKNAMLPVVTMGGVQFGHLLGGVVIVETIFGLPGMGLQLVASVVHRDWPMIQTVIVLVAGVFLTINLSVDLLYAWLNPRIRYG